MGIFDAFKGFDWNPDSGDIVDPPSAVKNTGWKLLDIPPAEYFNWFWSRVSAAFQRIADTQIPLLRTRDECVGDDMQGRVFCYQPEMDVEGVDLGAGAPGPWVVENYTGTWKGGAVFGVATDGSGPLIQTPRSVSGYNIRRFTLAVMPTVSVFQIPGASQADGISSDGQTLAAVGINTVTGNREVRTYDLNTGTLIHSAVLTGAQRKVAQIGKYTVAAGSVDNKVAVLDDAGSLTEHTLTDIGRALAVCGFGDFAFVVGEAGGSFSDSVNTVYLSTGTVLPQVRDGKDTYCCATDGRFLYVGGEATGAGNTVKRIDPFATTDPLEANPGSMGPVHHIAVDDRFLYLATDNFTQVTVADKRTLEAVDVAYFTGEGWQQMAVDAWGLMLFKDNAARRLYLPGHHTGFKRMLSIPDPTVERLPATRTPFNHAVLPVR